MKIKPELQPQKENKEDDIVLKIVCLIIVSLFIFSFSGCSQTGNSKKASELRKQITTLEKELQLIQEENRILREKYKVDMAEVIKMEDRCKLINEKLPDLDRNDEKLKALEKAVEEERAKSKG
jgi:vacuolar-type H+-ATPase subunit I/STV1